MKKSDRHQAKSNFSENAETACNSNAHIEFSGGRNTRPIDPHYAAYERRKAEWLESHPNASQAEYSAAMQRIAGEIGI
jgi:hypothetical protein